jgi:hypothetical protein
VNSKLLLSTSAALIGIFSRGCAKKRRGLWMLNDLRELRLWHFLVGGALLLIISLYQVYGAVGEQWDRSDVLAHGRDAQARVVRATGLDSVLIEWTGEGSRQLTAESKTGKAFARSGLGTMVLIKYDPALIREPVILSEVPEREQFDAFWLRSGLFVVAGLAAICATAVFSMLRVRRTRGGATPK